MTAGDYTIRPARMEDHGSIASFTRDTFSWGDYVTRVYKDWIADPNGLVLVAADRDDAAVAMAKVTLVADGEAWAQGARVHPKHRRRGLATRISDELGAWAAEQGARVVRLVVENWNRPAQAQVEAMGYRPVSQWIFAERAIGAASPVPEGNGGKRVPAPERLRSVPSSEAEPAYLAWSASKLAAAARNLYPVGWSWRRLRVEHLREAARAQTLWESPSGWAVAAIEDAACSVSWLTTDPADAPRMVRALVDLALEQSAESFTVKVPRVDWMERALRRLGCDLSPMTVYAMALDAGD